MATPNPVWEHVHHVTQKYNNLSNYEVWCKFRIAAKVQDALHRNFQEVNLGQHFGACSEEDLEAQCKHLILSFN